MDAVLRALVISSDIEALQHIQAAFGKIPHVQLSLHTDWLVSTRQAPAPNVLILHGDAPLDWLRNLRRHGFGQPALVLTDDTEHPAIAPLEDDLRPLENVTWAVLRMGGLPRCLDSVMGIY